MEERQQIETVDDAKQVLHEEAVKRADYIIDHTENLSEAVDVAIWDLRVTLEAKRLLEGLYEK